MKRALEYIKSHESDRIRDLAELVSVPSVIPTAHIRPRSARRPNSSVNR